MSRFSIQTLNNISNVGLKRLPEKRYAVANDTAKPDAILVRSQKMHDLPIPDSVRAIGRAGAGTDNIPVAKLSARGVPVFNAPGANANAVNELVLTALLLASRNLVPALNFVRDMPESDDKALHALMEDKKKLFAGRELPDHTLGIIGLGAIGSLVAETAIKLGMKVVGYDPEITVEGAWRLPSQVKKAESVEEVVKAGDFITLHVPLVEKTRHLINAERIALMRNHAVLLNFARDGLVDDAAVIAAFAIEENSNTISLIFLRRNYAIIRKSSRFRTWALPQPRLRRIAPSWWSISYGISSNTVTSATRLIFRTRNCRGNRRFVWVLPMPTSPTCWRRYQAVLGNPT